jgi:hypothetical protein
MKTLTFIEKDRTIFEMLFESLYGYDQNVLKPDRKFYKTHKKIAKKFKEIGVAIVPEQKKLDVILLTLPVLNDNDFVEISLEDTEFELLNKIFDSVNWIPLVANRITDIIEYLESIEE